jgi:hypothetical protein
MCLHLVIAPSGSGKLSRPQVFVDVTLPHVQARNTPVVALEADSER